MPLPWWKGGLRLGALAALVIGLPGALPAQVTLGADAGVFSAYVWRGLSLTNRPVLQPDAWLSVPAGGGSFLLSGWANVDLGRYNDPSDELSEGGGTGSLNVTEVDLTAEYGHGLGAGLSGAVGAIVYLFPNDAGFTDDLNTTEIYGRLQASRLPLAPKVTVWYDVNKVKGAYIEANVSQALPIKALPITLGATAAFSAGQAVNRADPGEVANFKENGFVHGDLYATASLAAGPVTIAPAVHFHLCNDEFVKVTSPTSTSDAKLWAGFSVSWSRALGATRAE
ncbi:MAG TPA: TorF family putative porin [Gemmatimonadales bacterium]|jgi:hypothetical protein|nr:TorF family putative porin [Gemmatimonadales bacterium]